MDGGNDGWGRRFEVASLAFPYSIKQLSFKIYILSTLLGSPGTLLNLRLESSVNLLTVLPDLHHDEILVIFVKHPISDLYYP